MATYTQNTNAVANILNRRGETVIVDNLKVASDFDNLIMTKQEYGDTLEHIQTALVESEAYDVKSNDMADYKDTVLNKVYSQTPYNRLFLASTPQEEYKKALKNAKALGDLSQSVLGKMNKTWKYELYKKFVDMMENDTFTTSTTVENFTNFDIITKAERDEKIEKFLQQMFEAIIKLGFMTNDYIKLDSALTTEEKARMIATAPTGELTIYLNSSYFSWAQVDLSKRFRGMLDMGKEVNIKIINFTDATKPGFIAHDRRYQFVPRNIVAKETQPFKSTRTDHGLIVEGQFAVVPVFPATNFVQKAIV